MIIKNYNLKFSKDLWNWDMAPDKILKKINFNNYKNKFWKLQFLKLFKIINTLYINIIFKIFDYGEWEFQDEYNIQIEKEN